VGAILTEFAEWLIALIKQLFGFVWDFVIDLFISALELVLLAFAQAFQYVVVPCFMSANSALSLSSAFNHVPSYIWFFASHLDLRGLFGILSCAILFVFARKLLTLFQW
jgi:hypothetical protein